MQNNEIVYFGFCRPEILSLQFQENNTLTEQQQQHKVSKLLYNF